ncbi:MAG: ChbG/HpnK family deacetylase [Methylophilus sp.]
MMHQLMICADDYAQSEEIDSAILDLIQNDRLTATSCLTLSPRWKKASQRITTQIRDKAAIGLHLDFTQYAVSQSALSTLIMRSYLRLLDQEKIAASIHRQLDAFEDALNTPPDYIDGHQHVHQLPQIRESLIDILQRRYPEQKPWIRIAKPPVQDGIKAMIIRGLGSSALISLAKQHHISYSKTLLGVYGFQNDSAFYQHKLNQWFAQIERGASKQPVVLMCHPSLNGSNTGDDAIYSARLMEYQTLSSAELLKLMQQYNIKLVKHIV